MFPLTPLNSNNLDSFHFKTHRNFQTTNKISRRLYEKCKKTRPSVEAHTCNSSYSGGRDQEDCSLRTTRENS
jgi:hypothetical protein